MQDTHGRVWDLLRTQHIIVPPGSGISIDDLDMWDFAYVTYTGPTPLFVTPHMPQDPIHFGGCI